MERIVRNLSLAVSFTCGVIVATLGAFRGLDFFELVMASAVTITSIFLLVRILGGYYAKVITRKLAETRAERRQRQLVDP